LHVAAGTRRRRGPANCPEQLVRSGADARFLVESRDEIETGSEVLPKQRVCCEACDTIAP